MKHALGGIKSNGRKLLAKLLKATKESFTVKQAAAALELENRKVISLLSLWAKNGWLHRIKRGLYTSIPLQSTSTKITPTEPWLIAQNLFSPCYIGGWTAAHYWGFTEQLYNTEFVLTTKKVHQRDLKLDGVQFKIKTITKEKLFGMQSIWSGHNKIAISDPTKTIIDGLNDPSILGGLRMLIDILQAYIHSEQYDANKLLAYAEKMHNSAIYKRLGFLLESIKMDKSSSELIEKCLAQIKSGYSQLDTKTPGVHLITRWNLWVPEKRAKDFDD